MAKHAEADRSSVAMKADEAYEFLVKAVLRLSSTSSLLSSLRGLTMSLCFVLQATRPMAQLSRALPWKAASTSFWLEIAAAVVMRLRMPNWVRTWCRPDTCREGVRSSASACECGMQMPIHHRRAPPCSIWRTISAAVCPRPVEVLVVGASPAGVAFKTPARHEVAPRVGM